VNSVWKRPALIRFVFADFGMICAGKGICLLRLARKEQAHDQRGWRETKSLARCKAIYPTLRAKRKVSQTVAILFATKCAVIDNLGIQDGSTLNPTPPCAQPWCRFADLSEVWLDADSIWKRQAHRVAVGQPSESRHGTSYRETFRQ